MSGFASALDKLSREWDSFSSGSLVLHVSSVIGRVSSGQRRLATSEIKVVAPLVIRELKKVSFKMLQDRFRWLLSNGIPVRSLCVALTLTNAMVFMGATVQAQDSTLPNLIFIMADDLGYGDVQALNPKSRIPTPRLNQLASAGMTFTDAHTPSAVCTPTRYGVLTGRYCWRTRLKSGVLNGYGEPMIADSRVTVAEFLREQGYATGIVGKWHLGLGFAKENDEFDFSIPISNGPHTHGFDSSFIIPASLDFPPYVYIRNGRITQFPELVQPAQKFPAFLRTGERSEDFVMENVLDELAAQAVSFIQTEAARNRPFLLYLPLTAPHKPVLPHPRYRGSTELGPYGDFVHQVDDIVGQVLDGVDQAGVGESTLVVFTSDNGSFMYRYDDSTQQQDHVDDTTVQGYLSSRHTANGPFRGTKADIWEAGHRVPFFVRWPGKVTAGSTCDRTVCLTDFFATAADILDVKLPSETAPDSFSFLPLLLDRESEWQREPVIHHSAAGMFAIREGDWKLVLGNGSGGRQAPRGKPFEEPYQLFNLRDDPGESQNLIEQHPEIAARLRARCDEIRHSQR